MRSVTCNACPLGRRWIMLQKLADHIAGALSERSLSSGGGRARRLPLSSASSYDEVAKAWRHLAGSYQFTESLERFPLDRDLMKKPAAPSIAPETRPAKQKSA